MRILKSLVAVGTVAATATALAMAPAVADPVNSKGHAVKPKLFDIVGVGSNTTQFLLDQFSVNYNKAHSKVHNAKHPWLYSWDATPPGQPDNDTQQISTKSGCPKVVRPDSSGVGVSTLFDNTKHAKHFCIDFSRSSSAQSATQPPFAPGGLAFVTMARDAVTWAANATTNAPATLTVADLKGIYGTCSITNWDQVGGKNGKIDAIVPELNSGTLKFFLTQVGGGTELSLGSCVNVTALPEENEGTAPVYKNNPNAIVPFSVGSYIAQGHHSASCKKKPKKTQNEFGCNAVGKFVLHKINGSAPTVGTGARTKINSKFTKGLFVRFLYNVVRYDTNTADHIPPLEAPIFSNHGYFCSKAGAKVIASYGFLTTPLCGISN